MRLVLQLSPQLVELFATRLFRSHQRRKQHHRRDHVHGEQSRNRNLHFLADIANVGHQGVLALLVPPSASSGT